MEITDLNANERVGPPFADIDARIKSNETGDFNVFFAVLEETTRISGEESNKRN